MSYRNENQVLNIMFKLTKKHKLGLAENLRHAAFVSESALPLEYGTAKQVRGDAGILTF